MGVGRRMFGVSYLGRVGRLAQRVGHAPRARRGRRAPRSGKRGAEGRRGGGGADPASGGSATAAPRSKPDGEAGVKGATPRQAMRGGARRSGQAAAGAAPRPMPPLTFRPPPPPPNRQDLSSVWRGGGCQKTFGGEAGGGEGGGGEARGARGADAPLAPMPPALRGAGRARKPPMLRVRLSVAPGFMRVGLSGALVSPIACPSGSVGLSVALVSPASRPSCAFESGSGVGACALVYPGRWFRPQAAHHARSFTRGMAFGRDDGLASSPTGAHRESGSNGPCPRSMTCDGCGCDDQKSAGW